MFTKMQKLGRVARVVGLLSLVAVLSGLLLSAAPASAAGKGGGELSVYVGDAATFANVADATVVVQNSTNNVQIKGLTDADGYFKIAVAAGPYTVHVFADGYEAQKAMVGVQVGATSKLAFLLKQGSADVAPAFIVPQSTLAVHAVSGATGANVANAVVYVRNTAGLNLLKGETDRAGEFKIDLPQGEYVVVIEAAAYQPYKVAVVVDNNPTISLSVKLDLALTTSAPPPKD